ncbi:MAG: calcium-binding protein, partial [Actinomycetota bacterium]
LASGPASDEDGATWSGDTITGGEGDDDIEGGSGNDLIFGNGTPDTGRDEDDIIGGGSANDGKIDDDRLGNGASLLDGRDVIHGDSGVNAAGDDDVIVGDNGWIKRPGTKQTGIGPDGATIDQFDRETLMVQTRPAASTFGGDFISGNGGHDELYGQAGNDYVEGGDGSDAIVGDLGKVTTDLLGNGGPVADLCTGPVTITTNSPFLSQTLCVAGTLFRRVELFAYNDTQSATVVEGADVLLGLDGADWIHGGAGADLINGDGDGGSLIADSTFPYTQTATDPNPATSDNDRLFGGDSNRNGTVNSTLGGNGDALWGGRGRDMLYGGNGDDMLDVRPDGVYPSTWSA